MARNVRLGLRSNNLFLAVESQDGGNLTITFFVGKAVSTTLLSRNYFVNKIYAMSYLIVEIFTLVK